jgi:hypothetical protein
VLDVAELVPVRAKAPSIVIDSDTHELSSTASKHYRAGGTSKLSLQLPSAHTHIVRNAGAAGGGSSAAAAAVTSSDQHGDAAWQELLKSRQGKQQGGKVSRSCSSSVAWKCVAQPEAAMTERALFVNVLHCRILQVLLHKRTRLAALAASRVADNELIAELDAACR